MLFSIFDTSFIKRTNYEINYCVSVIESCSVKLRTTNWWSADEVNVGCWQVDILVEYGYYRLIIDGKSIGCSMVWLYLFTG